MSSAELWQAAMLAQEHFNKDGQLVDLEEAIELFRQLMESTVQLPEDTTVTPHDIPIRFLNLLSAKYRVYEHPSILDDWETAARRALQLCSTSCADYSAVLAMVGGALSCRSRTYGNVKDLTEASEYLQQSVNCCPLDSHYYALCLYWLGHTLYTQMNITGCSDIWERAATVYGDILLIPELPIYLRADTCDSLGELLSQTHQYTGELCHLEDALAIAQEAMTVRQQGHALSSATCYLLSSIFLSKYISSGITDNLEICRAHAQSALHLLPPRSARRAKPLNKLALSLLYPSLDTEDLHKIDEGIELLREALSFALPDTTYYEMILHNIGGGLCQRYVTTQSIADLEESIAYLRHALSLTKKGHQRRRQALYNLGHAILKRYEELGQPQDLEDVIKFCREVLPFGLKNETRGWALYTLSEALLRRNAGGDIEESISLLDQAASLPSGVNTGFIYLLLGNALLQRAENSSSCADVNNALLHINKVLHLPLATMYQRHLAMWHLAEAHYMHFKITRSKDAWFKAIELSHSARYEGKEQYIQEICNIQLAQLYLEPEGPLSSLETSSRFIQAHLENDYHSPQIRLRDTLVFLRTVSAKEHSVNTIIKTPTLGLLAVYEGAVRLLPRITYLGTNIKSRLEALGCAEELSLHGAACALSLAKPKVALEILEQGRGIFWLQSLQLRTPLNDVPEDLRNQLTETSAHLERRSFMIPSLSKSQEDAEREATQSRQEAEKLSETLARVRSIPGLERFLLHEPADCLVEAGALGPVVILIQNHSCSYAIAINTDCKIQTLQLPGVSQEWLLETSKTWDTMTCASRSRMLDTDRLDLKIRAKAQSYILREKRLLEDLWKRIVYPVIHILKLEPCNGRDRPRLWWIPTGIFSFLPLHAAGDARSCCSSFVVSSFAPSLATLSSLRRHQHSISRNKAQTLIGAVPSAPSQNVMNLPQTTEEVNGIQKILYHLRPRDKGTEDTVHVKLGITVTEFLDMLPQANILHLACHGQQDPKNPLESRFILRDGPVSIATLMPLPLPNAFFAFLSACETAKGDGLQPDQLIHLAATMLFAGFKSVIGTMWNMNDHDGPFVSRIVYQQLFGQEGDTLDPNIIPYALDDAVQQLREQGVSPSRWATYIHLGM